MSQTVIYVLGFLGLALVIVSLSFERHEESQGTIDLGRGPTNWHRVVHGRWLGKWGKIGLVMFVVAIVLWFAS
jgi:hypothetical protein